MEAEPQDGLRLLREGETDLVLAFSYAAVSGRDGKDLTTVPLLRDPSHAILPAARTAAGVDGPIDLASLAGDAWIAGCERCRRHLLHVAEEAGFTPRIDFETDDYLTVQSLVAAGLGVSLLPALALCSARRDDVRRPPGGRAPRARSRRSCPPPTAARPRSPRRSQHCRERARRWRRTRTPPRSVSRRSERRCG